MYARVSLSLLWISTSFFELSLCVRAFSLSEVASGVTIVEWRRVDCVWAAAIDRALNFTSARVNSAQFYPLSPAARSLLPTGRAFRFPIRLVFEPSQFCARATVC